MKRRLLQQQTQHVSFGFERENLKISDISSCFFYFSNVFDFGPNALLY